MNMNYFRTVLFVFTTLFTISPVLSAVIIVVNSGDFETVEEAAYSEKKVDWWDANSEDDTACTESFAAMELELFLPQCVAIKPEMIRFADTSKMPADEDVFLVGTRISNPLIRTYVPKEPDLKTDQSFAIRSVKRNNRSVIVIEGKTRIGVLYGVYEYLRQSGIRFYGLGQTGTVFPAQTLPRLDSEVSCTENPSFLTRGFWAEIQNIGHPDFFLWMARNRMNLWSTNDADFWLMKKLGIKLSGGGHSVMADCFNPHAIYPYNHAKFEKDDNLPGDLYPVSSVYQGDADSDGKLCYFEAHPEWFGLRDDKRTGIIEGAGRCNYCTSNKDATNEFAKNLLNELVAGKYQYADIMSVWLLDNGDWCECGNCSKQGNCTDKVFELMMVILNKLDQAKKQGVLGRNVLISTCAYHETLPPPTKKLPDDFDYDNFMINFFPIERCYVHSFADTKCTEINAELLDKYRPWVQGQQRTYKGQMFIGEYFNVSSIMSLPAVYTEIMATDIPWYYQTGTRHFCYMHCPTTQWGTWTLNQSLLAELLWNVQLDSEKFINEYFESYYPTTNKYIRSFYKNLEDAFANIKAFKHYVIFNKRYRLRNTLDQDSEEIFPIKHLKYDVSRSDTDDGPDVVEMMESMDKAGINIDTALLYCMDAAEKQRLMEDYRRYQYGAAMYEFYYRMIRTAMFHRQGDKDMTQSEFARAAKSAQTLDNFKDLIMPNQDGSQKTGMEATQMEKQFDYFQNLYGNTK